MLIRVGIMGAGSAAKDLLSILPDNVRVLGLGDNDPASHGWMDGHQVMSVEDLLAYQLDYVVVACRSVDEMRAQIEKAGYPAHRILAYYSSYSGQLLRAVNADISALNDKLGIGVPPAGVATMYLWPGVVPSEPMSDFVRQQSFLLAAERIKEQAIPGAIAELGVYQGEQAAFLNRLFPGRTLHLFDTFEGFSNRDMAGEDGFSAALPGDFSNTSVELVLSRMADQSTVCIHRGFFPESAIGVDEEFSLVSLDVDLHDPTASGLRWFYPRLSKGGYIFVHDYNNRRYLGVRRAVEDFVKETGACAVPIPDFAGSMIITK